MLDDLNELRTLRAIIASGSLSAAARSLGVSLAVVSKRLATLERRVGVRLVNRTTRSLSPTEEGLRALDGIERALEALEEVEEDLETGQDEPVGTLRVAAPVSFGRRHVAPVLASLVDRHARLNAALSLNDRLVDIAGGSFDVAIRIGGLEDSTATMLKLAENSRILAAAPAYLDRRGRPQTPADLTGHAVLRYGDIAVPWVLRQANGETATIEARPRLRADSGEVMHDWCLSGHGIMLKSLVDIDDDLKEKRLERILPEWDTGSMPVVALFAGRRNRSRKLCVFLDAMKDSLPSFSD